MLRYENLSGSKSVWDLHSNPIIRFELFELAHDPFLGSFQEAFRKLVSLSIFFRTILFQSV
jgi:hypothetical protein